MIGKICLEGLEFHAFHGVYPHERESGNWFEVDISVGTEIIQGAGRDDAALGDTVLGHQPVDQPRRGGCLLLGDLVAVGRDVLDPD